MNSLRKFRTERSDDLKYVCGSQAVEMRTKQWKTFSIYLVVNIEMPVIWHGERIGRRKKKRARGGRWQEEREEASPLVPSHRFFDYSSHRRRASVEERAETYSPITLTLYSAPFCSFISV